MAESKTTETNGKTPKNLEWNPSKWPRVVIGVPMERNINQHAFFHFWGIAQHGWPLIKLPYSLRNDRARDQFARHLLDSDYTHLIMMDSDHKHPTDIVQRFVRWIVDDPTRLVIGGLNYRRATPYNPCVFLPNEDGTWYSPVDWPEGLVKVANEHGRGYIGTGSIIIAREVFEMLEPPWFGFAYDEYPDNWPGVDIWFSKKCAEAGIDLWIDTTITGPHHIDEWVDGTTFKEYLAAHGDDVNLTDGAGTKVELIKE